MTIHRKYFWLFFIFCFSFIKYDDAFAAEKPKIALVFKSLNNEYFKEMKSAAENYQKNSNTKFTLIIKSTEKENDFENQIKIMESLIKSKVNAIIVAPNDKTKLIPIATKAVNEKIIVVNLDDKLEEKILAKNMTNIPFVGPNNYLAAKSLGEYLSFFLNNGDRVGIIQGSENSSNSTLRKEGFIDGIQKKKIKISGIKSGDWEEEKAKLATLALIKENKNINAIFCASDLMALGALKATTELNLKNKIKILGFDNVSKISPFIKSKEIFATVSQFPERQIEVALYLVLDALKNKYAQSNLPKVLTTKTIVINNESTP